MPSDLSPCREYSFLVTNPLEIWFSFRKHTFLDFFVYVQVVKSINHLQKMYSGTYYNLLVPCLYSMLI